MKENFSRKIVIEKSVIGAILFVGKKYNKKLRNNLRIFFNNVKIYGESISFAADKFPHFIFSFYFYHFSCDFEMFGASVFYGSSIIYFNLISIMLLKINLWISRIFFGPVIE
jgi:hypothetical protein